MTAGRLPTEQERLHGWAQREVIRGALDADVLERAVVIAGLLSLDTFASRIKARILCKVLGDMAATKRERQRR